MTTCQGPDLRVYVELRGFEPLTPSMRTRCATGLRYSPRDGSQRSKRRPVRASAPPRRRRSGSAAEAPTRGSVADRTVGHVGVLVVDLVRDPAGDVDDLSGGLADALPCGRCARELTARPWCRRLTGALGWYVGGGRLGGRIGAVGHGGTRRLGEAHGA